MSKKQNAFGLSTLLLGFSVGTLGEQTIVDAEKVVKYSPVTNDDNIDDSLDGKSLDLNNTAIDASVWDEANNFLNFDSNKEEEKVVYVSNSTPDESNESYTDMVSSLLSAIDTSSED